jgi:hypothetical protein
MISAAVETPYSVEVAMQLDDVDASSPLVETVNILRDQLLQSPCGREPSQSMMSNVGLGTGHDPPANHAAYPIPLPHRLIAQEVVQKNRRRSLPSAFGVSIARDARIGAYSRAGEDKQPGMLLCEVVQIAHCPLSGRSNVDV